MTIKISYKDGYRRSITLKMEIFMIRRKYALALLLSLGFLSTCCAEEDLSTFFGQLEEQVKNLEAKTNPPKKDLAPELLVNTEAPATPVAEEPVVEKMPEATPQPVASDSLEDDEDEIELELDEIE